MSVFGIALLRNHVPCLAGRLDIVGFGNHRLLAFDGAHVTFSYKDYARDEQRCTMTLTAVEFLRRFVQHILPRGFVRIRQSGLLANACRIVRLTRARQLLAPAPTPTTPATTPPDATPLPSPAPATWRCPHCGAAMTVGRILNALELATLTWSFDTS